MFKRGCALGCIREYADEAMLKNVFCRDDFRAVASGLEECINAWIRAIIYFERSHQSCEMILAFFRIEALICACAFAASKASPLEG